MLLKASAAEGAPGFAQELLQAGKVCHCLQEHPESSTAQPKTRTQAQGGDTATSVLRPTLFIS